jgi:hypothetical protein
MRVSSRSRKNARPSRRAFHFLRISQFTALRRFLLRLTLTLTEEATPTAWTRESSPQQRRSHSRAVSHYVENCEELLHGLKVNASMMMLPPVTLIHVGVTLPADACSAASRLGQRAKARYPVPAAPESP